MKAREEREEKTGFYLERHRDAFVTLFGSRVVMTSELRSPGRWVALLQPHNKCTDMTHRCLQLNKGCGGLLVLQVENKLFLVSQVLVY